MVRVVIKQNHVAKMWSIRKRCVQVVVAGVADIGVVFRDVVARHAASPPAAAAAFTSSTA